MNKLKQDFISIEGMKVFAYHGVLEREKAEGQDFFISCRLYYDLRPAAESDDLSLALDYGDCCGYMAKVFGEKSYDLIETAAEMLCWKMLLHYPQLTAIDLKLSKPHAPVGFPIRDVAVNISRGWHRVYISAGSNMGDRRAYIEGGIRQLGSTEGIRGLRASELVETEPYGVTDQPLFLNGAIELETFLEPYELLDRLHEVEKRAGRIRKEHWGPRTLDLDIIFYDDLVCQDSRLTIPHIDMENRLFVLEPLAQLAPDLRHPILGLSVSRLLSAARHRERERNSWNSGR